MTPAEATAFVHAAVPALGRLGLQVADIGPGRVRLHMPFEGNGNHMGTMYAGALFAIAELPGGLVPLSALQGKAVPLLKELSIRYLRPARGDVWLDAAMEPEALEALVAEAASAGRADYVLALRVVDDAGEIVAESTGTYQLRPV